MSRWTRLCELDIPSTVEDHLRNPTEERLHLPSALLQLEHRLAEPVKVHNDDKLRRHKLQQQKNSEKNSQPSESQQEDPQNQCGVEMSAALAKMSVDGAPPIPTTRERSDVRKVKTTELPELEHVFAEGLYFTLTDVVLLPCIHQFLVKENFSGSFHLRKQTFIYFFFHFIWLPMLHKLSTNTCTDSSSQDIFGATSLLASFILDSLM